MGHNHTRLTFFAGYSTKARVRAEVLLLLHPSKTRLVFGKNFLRSSRRHHAAQPLPETQVRLRDGRKQPDTKTPGVNDGQIHHHLTQRLLTMAAACLGMVCNGGFASKGCGRPRVRAA